MKTKTVKNRIIPALAVILSVCMLLSSCGNTITAGVKKISSVTSRNVISRPSEDLKAIHYSASRDSFENTGVASGFLELWADKETCSLGVYDKSADVLWSALPLLSETTEGSANDASMVSLRIIGGTDIYNLNSQDNSVAYGTSAMVERDGSFHLSYSIFDSAETAAKTPLTEDDIGFRVELDVMLTDGNMTVDCQYENITGNKNAYIEDIELMNFFGTYTNTDKGNFLFVPDGCGAVIDTSVYDESFESLSFAVYGADLANPDEYSGSAIIPAFGMKRNSAAFVALIENGDAVSTIKAEKATNIGGRNRVYSSFNIVPSSYENETLNISKKSSVDKITLCYRFLSGSNATYAGMASAVREQLIRNNVISTQTMKTTDYLPFFLTLTGAGKKEIGRFSYDTTLTDFDQAQDMLVRMKNKGINNITVRYSSIYTGGCDSGDIKKAHIQARLGGNSGFAKLQEYINGQNMSLFADIDILSSANGFGDDEIHTIYNEPGVYNREDSLITSMGASPAARSLRKISDLKSTVSSVLASFRSYECAGVCLDDAGSILYSDFTENGMLRQDASRMIAKTISPLSTGKGIMISTGNFYMLKNIDAVIDIPLSTSVAKSGAYTPVPFVQLILHGITDYTGEAINISENRNQTLLKYIEYGACPHYKWNYNSVMADSENDIYYYDNTINSAADYYSEATAALNDLRDARMTDHYEISDGVFCTEYDTGALIYVNYTDSDYTALGAVVRAGSFLRVN